MTVSKTYSFPPDVTVMEVIRVEIVEGEGIETSPVRRVLYYYARDGRVLARVDEWEQEEKTCK